MKRWICHTSAHVGKLTFCCPSILHKAAVTAHTKCRGILNHSNSVVES